MSASASLFPHGTSSGPEICARRQSTVGAGLPAKASGQLALMLDVLASSRASPLPHGGVLVCLLMPVFEAAGFFFDADAFDRFAHAFLEPASIHQ